MESLELMSSIYELGLEHGVADRLKRFGIHTINDLIKISTKDYSAIPQNKRMNIQIKTALANSDLVGEKDLIKFDCTKYSLNSKKQSLKQQSILKYPSSHIKQYNLTLNTKYDKEIISFLETKDNKAGYLKQLIQADMGKGTNN